MSVSISGGTEVILKEIVHPRMKIQLQYYLVTPMRMESWKLQSFLVHKTFLEHHSKSMLQHSPKHWSRWGCFNM